MAMKTIDDLFMHFAPHCRRLVMPIVVTDDRTVVLHKLITAKDGIYSPEYKKSG